MIRRTNPSYNILEDVKSAAKIKLNSESPFDLALSPTLIEDVSEAIAEVVIDEEASWRNPETPGQNLSWAERKRLLRTAEVFEEHDGRPGGLAFIILDEERCGQWRSTVMEVAKECIRYVRTVEDMQ